MMLSHIPLPLVPVSISVNEFINGGGKGGDGGGELVDSVDGVTPPTAARQSAAYIQRGRESSGLAQSAADETSSSIVGR
jgi:hypothetical protein